MKANHFAPALALSLVVALAGPSAEAQHRGGGGGGGSRGGGGGWHGGGGSHGGGGGWHGGGRGGGYGYAVPRGSGGGWHGGGVAGARHPQGGTGYYGRYYGGHYGGYGGHHGGYYGGYRGYYGGYYRPYYPYYYGGYWPYYGSSFALSFGWGWPYYYNVAPYAGVSYTYAPSDSSGYSMQAPSDDEQPAPERREAEPGVVTTREAGSLRLEVRPEDTSVYVDDGFRGTAREARILRLGAGRHTIELVRPGYAIERHEVEIVTGERSDLLVEMLRPR